MVAFASAVYAFMSAYFHWRNEKRAKGLENWKTEGKTDEEVKDLGDESPKFVFTS